MTTAAKTRIYARSIARRWVALVKASPCNVIVLSPYLTSRTADSVVAGATCATCRIFTLFDAETFASGASSLTTVKKLVTAGYQVHHLADLHAKSVITEQAASVGSQNLTVNGTRKREITALIFAQDEAASLREKIAPWLDTAHLITADHIAAMEPLVRALQRDYRKLRKRFAEADQAVLEEVKQAETQREQEAATAAARAKRDLYRRIRSRSAALRAALAAGRQAATTVWLRRGTGAYDNMQSGKGYSSGYYDVLRAGRSSSLLQWRLDDDTTVHVEKTYRHLMVYENTGRLAWPAFFETQISKMAKSVELPTSMLPGLSAKLDYELIWDHNELQTRNVRVTLTCAALNLKITVGGYFSLSAFTITEIEDTADVQWRTRLGDLVQPRLARRITSVIDDHERLADELRRPLLRPFRFDKNSHNAGLSRFLDGAETRDFRLSLRIVEHQRIFVLSES